MRKYGNFKIFLENLSGSCKYRFKILFLNYFDPIVSAVDLTIIDLFDSLTTKTGEFMPKYLLSTMNNRPGIKICSKRLMVFNIG